MKALIIITFVVTILQAELWAQSGKPREMKGNITERKVENSTYIFVEQGNMYTVYNKTNVLMITESRF